MAANDGSGVTTKRTSLTQAEQDAVNKDFDRTHSGPMADGSMARKARDNQTKAHEKNYDDVMKENGA